MEKNLETKLFSLVMLLYLHLNQVYSTTCQCTTDSPFPIILGSTDGATEFLAIDMDGNQNAIIGGFSQSPILVSSSSIVPIYVKIDTTTGDYLWEYYFSNLVGKIIEVAYQNSVYTYTTMLFFPSSTSGYQQIIIINSSSGSLYASYLLSIDVNPNSCDGYEGYNTEQCFVITHELIFSSLNQIYLGIEQGVYYIISFTAIPVTSSTSWIMEYAASYSDVSTLIFGKDESEIFTGGSLNQFGITNPIVSHMISSTGAVDWQLTTSSIDFYGSIGGWDFPFISQLYYLSQTYPKVTAFASSYFCTHNLILIVDLDSSNAYSSNQIYEFQNTNSVCFYCRAIYSEIVSGQVSTTLLLHDIGDSLHTSGDGYMYLATHNTANTYVQVQAIQNVGSHSSITAQSMTAGVIKSSSLMFFVGYTDKITGSSYTQAFSQPTAFLMSGVSTYNFISLTLTTTQLTFDTITYSFTKYTNIIYSYPAQITLTQFPLIQASISISNNIATNAITTFTYQCTIGPTTLSIYAPSITSSIVYCEVLAECYIPIGTYKTGPTNCNDAVFIISFSMNGVTQTTSTYSAFPMTLTQTSANYVSLDMTPLSTMSGMSYTILISAILDQVPQQVDNSYTFTLKINSLSIAPPSVTSSTVSCYPNCQQTIIVGQYCVGYYVSTANCQDQSMTYSILVNGVVDSSFPMTLTNVQNYITLSVTSINSYVYSTYTITIKASMSAYPSITDSSYSFTLSTIKPSIAAPSITSSSINCYALETCSQAIGQYSVSPSCSGETLSYTMTASSVLVTSSNYYFYTMDLTDSSDYLTFTFVPNSEQLGLTYQIQIYATINEFPEVIDSSYKFNTLILEDCSSLSTSASSSFLYISAPSILYSTIQCHVLSQCSIEVGTYSSLCAGSVFTFSFSANGVTITSSNYASFPMTLSYTSTYDISLSMIPPESLYGLTYPIIVSATLSGTTPLTNSSYTFDLEFIAPVIVPPSVTTVDQYCDPNCACSIPIGQYCVGATVSNANCQAQSFTFTYLVNGSTDASFPGTITNSANDPTIVITPTNSFVYETHTITISAQLTLYPTVIDTSYIFYVHTNLPTIVNPSLVSTIECYALSNCTLNLGVFSVSPSCTDETLEYSFTFNGQSVTSINYINFKMNLTNSNNNLTFTFLPSSAQVGLTYKIQITASLVEFPQVTNTNYVFDAVVNLDCRVLKFLDAPVLNNLTYQVGSDELTFTFPEFELNVTGCTYIIYYMIVNGNWPTQAFLNQANIQYKQQVGIYTNDSSYVGYYILSVVGTIYKSTPKQQYQFTDLILTIYNTSTAYSISTAQSVAFKDQTFQANKISVYSIADSLQMTYQDFSINFGYGKAFNFTTYDEASETFTFTPNDYDVGVYPITVNVYLTAFQYSIKGIFSLTITGTTQSSNSSNSTNTTASNITVSNSSSTINAVKTDNLQYNISSQPLQAQIIKINNYGLVNILFADKITIPSNYSEWNSTNLAISITNSDDDSGQVVDVNNFTVTSITDYNMMLQLYFDNPDQISESTVTLSFFLPSTPSLFINKLINSQDWDSLNLVFNNQSQIYSIKDELILILPKHYVLHKKVPPQIQVNSKLSYLNRNSIGKTLSVLQSLAEAIMEFMNTVIFGNLGINLVLSTSLQQLWGMFSSFQIITHLPLYTISLPGQLGVLSYFMIQICQFNFVPLQNLIYKAFYFNDDTLYTSYNDQFNQMGFMSYNILVNNGSIVVLLLINAIITCLVVVISLLKFNHRLFLISSTYLQNKILYTLVLTFLIQGYLDFLICCLLNIQGLMYETSGEFAGSLVSVLLLIILLTLPIFVFMMLNGNKTKLSQDHFKVRFGSMYSCLHYDNKGVYYYVVFIMRRISISIAAVFLTNAAGYQLFVTLIGSMALLCYLITYQPFLSRQQNKIEIFNELSLYLICVTYLQFTDFTASSKAKRGCGWIGISVIVLNFTVNIGLLLINSFKTLFLYVKKKCLNFRELKRNQIQVDTMRGNTKIESTQGQDNTNITLLGQQQLAGTQQSILFNNFTRTIHSGIQAEEMKQSPPIQRGEKQFNYTFSIESIEDDDIEIRE